MQERKATRELKHKKSGPAPSKSISSIDGRLDWESNGSSSTLAQTHTSSDNETRTDKQQTRRPTKRYSQSISPTRLTAPAEPKKDWYKPEGVLNNQHTPRLQYIIRDRRPSRQFLSRSRRILCSRRPQNKRELRWAVNKGEAKDALREIMSRQASRS